MTIKNILKNLSTLFGHYPKSNDTEMTSTAKTKFIMRRPVLTDHFTIKSEESDNPYIVAIYDRAFTIIKKIDKLVLRSSMFCYRSGDWYILNVDLTPPTNNYDDTTEDSYIYERTLDDGVPWETRATYILDMSHDRIIQKDDFDALTNIFETLKTRMPYPNDDDEREYLYHITTILLAAAEPGGNFIEPNGGERFPEEVDFPKYAICGDSLIYTWYELSTGMAYHIIKHTLAWDGKTATHQKTEIDMSAPQKLWRKPDKPWR